MEPQPQPHKIHSVDQLRDLIGQAERGERLLVQIAPDISFEDARMLWEAASLDGEPEGVHELFNPEMLRSKMMAADFIGIKVCELKRERDYLNGQIGCLQSWYNLKGRQLQNGGPNISESHKGLHLFGPQMYLDVNKIGTMEQEALNEHRKEMLHDYLYMRVADAQAFNDYYKQESAKSRENRDQRSQKQINMHLLNLKMEDLVVLRDRISACIKYLEDLFSARIDMGCGDADFAAFRDIIIGNIGDDVDEIIG